MNNNSIQIEFNDVKVDLIRVPSGSYVMGSPEEPDSFPLIKHSLGEFMMSKTVITREVWSSLMKTAPWPCDRENDKKQMPATNVSRAEALEFCATFSKLSGISATLPSDAQWEYACRAGTTTRYHWGNDYESASDYAVFIPKDCPGIDFSKPSPVMTKRPNPWGFYDLPGNVCELVLDLFPFNAEGPYLRRDMFPERPKDFVSRTGEMGVRRGGCFGFNRLSLSSYKRLLGDPETRNRYTGFRVAINA